MGVGAPGTRPASRGMGVVSGYATVA